MAGELVVGDPEAGFATGVDLILMRKVRQTFKLELVEIKSGMGMQKQNKAHFFVFFQSRKAKKKFDFI